MAYGIVLCTTLSNVTHIVYSTHIVLCMLSNMTHIAYSTQPMASCCVQHYVT